MTFFSKTNFKVLIRKKRYSIPLLLIFFLFSSAIWSISTVLVAPGTDSVAARLAEWGRDHYLGGVITFAENIQYKLNPPKVGGKLNTELLNVFNSSGSLSGQILSPIVTPALPGEGIFKTVVSVGSAPAIRVAYLRPDQLHTSYLSGIAIMKSSLLRFALHPGFNEPGKLSNYRTLDHISPTALNGLFATFNSGFKIKDSMGGYFSEGFTAKPLVEGIASFVIYADGHADIGTWGRDFRMSSSVESVRQNLSLLVNNGRVNPQLDTDSFKKWGLTVKNAYYVWRSGVGVTSTGDIVYVAGNALSVKSLANLLQIAGATRAMELDINPSWVSYMWYPQDSNPLPQKLLPFKRPANRFLSPSSRDFFSVYQR